MRSPQAQKITPLFNISGLLEIHNMEIHSQSLSLKKRSKLQNFNIKTTQFQDQVQHNLFINDTSR